MMHDVMQKLTHFYLSKDLVEAVFVNVIVENPI